MKSDLERLMAEAKLDALLISGAAVNNPALTYFTGRVHISFADLLVRRGQEPVLFCRPMERDEAASTGLQTRNLDDYDPIQTLREAGGDPTLAEALRYQRMFSEYGVRGRLALAGRLDLGPSFAIFQRLQDLAPQVELVGQPAHGDVLTRARATKEASEVERIRQMGRITTAVVSDVASFLSSHRVRDGVLVDNRGEVLTVGEIKRRINLWLAMRGADNPEGTIFALGRDGGVPHSAGRADQPVEAGKAIVFDLFPCEAGGGYFYDFTRTWCLGHAPDEVLSAHQDVLAVYQMALAALTPGTPCRQYQAMTCEAFEARGHPTVMSDPRTERGYVHSLGHGVGLDVQEIPFFKDVDSNYDVLEPNSIITVEPGLYYPEQGFGVRLEDTVWIRPGGGVEVLAPYPMDLVVKMDGR